MFVEEPMSKVERIFGRRLPLAVLIICLVAWLVSIGKETTAGMLGGAFMIILHGYFDDVSSEKQTIKMISDKIQEE